MQQLAPDYLAEIARQIGFISAFLGGVAATLMVALLASPQRGRIATWSVASAAAACVAFIVAVVATTLLAVTLRPDAPANVATADALAKGRVLSFLCFVLGIYLLLACVGLSGWLRDRATGKATTALAAIGVVLISYAIVG